MPEVFRLCLYPVPFLHRWARRMSGKAAKKRLVKGVFNRGKCPGAEVRICRPAGCAAPEPRAENFIYELQAENCPEPANSTGSAINLHFNC